MPKFPEPPAPSSLRDVAPSWQIVSPSTVLWRVYWRAGPFPTTWHQFRQFGPVDARFDHHLPPAHDQVRGILYAAASPLTCLAEVFQRRRIVELGLADPWLVGFALSHELSLLDLTGLWPTRAGSSMAISSGQHARARRWSRAIYDAYPTGHGLWYSSSMNANAPAAALYERSAAALPTTPIFHRSLRDPPLLPMLRNAARDLGYLIAI